VEAGSSAFVFKMIIGKDLLFKVKVNLRIGLITGIFD
jgi:hypothetical protein